MLAFTQHIRLTFTLQGISVSSEFSLRLLPKLYTVMGVSSFCVRVGINRLKMLENNPSIYPNKVKGNPFSMLEVE